MTSKYISITDANGNIFSVEFIHLRCQVDEELCENGESIFNLSFSEINALKDLYLCLSERPLTEENIRRLIAEDTTTKPTCDTGIPLY